MGTFQKHKLASVFDVTDLVNISYYKLPKNYEFPGESHDFWEFIYIDKGSLIVTAGSTDYLLKAGEMAFHCPNEFHSFRPATPKQINVLVVAFCCASPEMKSLEHKIITLDQNEKQCLSLITKEAEAAYVYFDNVPPRMDLTKKSDAPFAGDQLIKSNLERLFIYIYRRDDMINLKSRSVSTNQFHYHAQAAAHICNYINEHYDEKITLEMLAHKLNISISQLKQIFKEQTGVSVITYLSNVRISEAKRMIRSGSSNFTQIAEAVGYSSIYYFSTTFKKHTGMTLTEYSHSIRP